MALQRPQRGLYQGTLWAGVGSLGHRRRDDGVRLIPAGQDPVEDVAEDLWPRGFLSKGFEVCLGVDMSRFCIDVILKGLL